MIRTTSNAQPIKLEYLKITDSITIKKIRLPNGVDGFLFFKETLFNSLRFNELMITNQARFP